MQFDEFTLTKTLSLYRTRCISDEFYKPTGGIIKTILIQIKRNRIRVQSAQRKCCPVNTGMQQCQNILYPDGQLVNYTIMAVVKFSLKTDIYPNISLHKH